MENFLGRNVFANLIRHTNGSAEHFDHMVLSCHVCCLELGCLFPGLPQTSWLTPEETTVLLLFSPSFRGMALTS